VVAPALQVNLVGALRVTQAFLPLMRPHTASTTSSTSGSNGTGQGVLPATDYKASSGAEGAPKTGRIINISSQAGTVALPLFGAYCASKFGLEAFR
jgi:NAD(P)-dependent dehydrogenase (short-subunit alcohol dehydrogenase family)